MTTCLKDKPFCIVIFGASGDLAMRMLVPSLETISCYTTFHPDTRIIGVARSTFQPGELEARYTEGIRQFSRISPDSGSENAACEMTSAFLKRFTYISGDYNSKATYDKLASEISKRPPTGVLVYLATPPTLIEPICRLLGESSIAKSKEYWTRLIIEKPFGVDYESAIHLNDIIHRSFDEEQIFRIDHYLAKETVLNIFTLRWGNTIWEPLWNRNYVSHVEIVVAESVEVGKRTGYYENASVIRDMIQNHLLQMLSIVAMEPPSVMNSKSIRDEKMKVLHAIRQLQWEDVILGQYDGYKSLEGVNDDSTTPTLAVCRFFIDNWRWQGVPFYIISGKALSQKSSSVNLVFQKVPHQIFGGTTIDKPNILKIQIQPDEGITLKQHVKIPGGGLHTRQIDLSFSYEDFFGKNALQGAYERVILDAINGDQSFFPRSDEIETSWKIVSPILHKKYFIIPYAKGLDISPGLTKRNVIIHPYRNYFTNAAEFVSTSTEAITRAICSSIEERHICHIAFSGGSTPRPILTLLSSTPYYSRFSKEIKNIHFWFVDERCVPPDHKDSNYKTIKESFFDYAKVPESQIHRMKGEVDPEKAAEQYQDEMIASMGKKPTFDLIILGMGADGHTASLFPGCPQSLENKKYVISHYVPQMKQNRISITSRTINKSRAVLFLLQGEEKKNAFELVRLGPYVPSLLPAQLVRPKNGTLTWNILL